MTRDDDRGGPMYADRRERLSRAIELVNGPTSRAEITAFSISHSELLISVQTDTAATVVFRLSGCARLECPVRWQGVKLEFQDTGSGMARYALVDHQARLHVSCGLILLGDPRIQDAVERPE
jgi:hypothetical protein